METQIVIHSTQVKDHLDQEKNAEKMNMGQKKKSTKGPLNSNCVHPLLCGLFT